MATESFLTYLTVFKSRLGLANLVLQLSGLVHQPDAALIRRLRGILERTEELRLNDPNAGPVLQYLKDKRLIAREAGGAGRYSAYASLELGGSGWQALGRHGESVSNIRVHATDIWLSNPDIPSTIGVPTPENVREPFELVFQLGLLSKSTNTWTAAGQLTSGLRTRFAKLISDEANPLLLSVEAVSLLRQLLAVDGFILTELIRTILQIDSEPISRDRIAEAFPTIVERAVDAVGEAKVGAPLLRQARAFLQTVQKTVANRQRVAKRSTTASGAPGMLEHRVSPRLEWLTDLGYLTKLRLPKNGFEYRVTGGLPSLLADLVELSNSDSRADEVAIRQWATNPAWSKLREQAASLPWPVSIRDAYQLMRRRIGPAPLREVAFAFCIVSAERNEFGASLGKIVDFAQNTRGASLSGGRYRRTPENIFVPDAALENG